MRIGACASFLHEHFHSSQKFLCTRFFVSSSIGDLLILFSAVSDETFYISLSSAEFIKAKVFLDAFSFFIRRRTNYTHARIRIRNCIIWRLAKLGHKECVMRTTPQAVRGAGFVVRSFSLVSCESKCGENDFRFRSRRNVNNQQLYPYPYVHDAQSLAAKNRISS